MSHLLSIPSKRFLLKSLCQSLSIKFSTEMICKLIIIQKNDTCQIHQLWQLLWLECFDGQPFTAVLCIVLLFLFCGKLFLKFLDTFNQQIFTYYCFFLLLKNVYQSCKCLLLMFLNFNFELFSQKLCGFFFFLSFFCTLKLALQFV